jgi:hypothetical protein
MLVTYTQTFCMKYDGLPDIRRAYNQASIVLLSKQAVPDDMAVAVSPNAAVIAGRAPLHSKPPLPWPNAYHATVEAGVSAVRIQTRLLNCVKKHLLPFDEQWSLDSYHREDTRKQCSIDGTSLRVDLVQAQTNQTIESQ